VKKIDKKDWIEEGFNALTETGPQALTIDTLCERLGVTKGSFYHHFRNRQDYIQELMEAWKQETTEAIVNRSRSEPEIAKRTEKLLRLVFDIPGKRDLAVRALALYEPSARLVQEKIDRSRRAYLEELNRSFFNDADAAGAMALIDYAWYLGIRTMVPPPDEDDMEKMTALYKKLKQLYLNAQKEE
jgi:AcrR family transcriptional regulator